MLDTFSDHHRRSGGAMWCTAAAVRSLRGAARLRPAMGMGEASSSRLLSVASTKTPISLICQRAQRMAHLHWSAVQRQDDNVPQTQQDVGGNQIESEDQELRSVSGEKTAESQDLPNPDTPAEPLPSAFSMPTLQPSDTLPEAFRAVQSTNSRGGSGAVGGAEARPFSRINLMASGARQTEMHRLHVQATRNNIIMTLTAANGDVIQRTSSGQLGFRNAARSSYDAAYRVAMFMFERIEQNRVTWGIAKIEIIWKGFGQGRDAVHRALLSNEGERVRNLIRRTADNTAIKVGGTRPKKRRML